MRLPLRDPNVAKPSKRQIKQLDNGGDELSLRSVGDRLGLSGERVRQIEGRALEKLRVELVKTQHDRAAFV